jgi:hypothetical protein
MTRPGSGGVWVVWSNNNPNEGIASNIFCILQFTINNVVLILFSRGLSLFLSLDRYETSLGLEFLELI